VTDMTEVIVPKSDQINSDDLIGGDLTITITGVQIVGGQEQPVSIAFAGSSKVYRPCKSMSRVLVAIWGPDAKRYVGRSLRLYRDPDVKWGGMAVGGIRIRAMTDMEGNRPVTMALTATKGARKPYTVVPLVVAAPDTGAQDAARAASKQGTVAFREWWGKADAARRDAAKPIMPELKALADEADAAMAADPFGLPPVEADPQPTEAELAAAEAAALAAAEEVAATAVAD
jgi:hypothetical protein